MALFDKVPSNFSYQLCITSFCFNWFLLSYNSLCFAILCLALCSALLHSTFLHNDKLMILLTFLPHPALLYFHLLLPNCAVLSFSLLKFSNALPEDPSRGGPRNPTRGGSSRNLPRKYLNKNTIKQIQIGDTSHGDAMLFFFDLRVLVLPGPLLGNYMV